MLISNWFVKIIVSEILISYWFSIIRVGENKRWISYWFVRIIDIEKLVSYWFGRGSDS